MKQYKDVTYDFSGKVAIITGASSGIFQGVAVAYGEAGAKVALTSNKNTAGCEETKRLIEETGGEANIYQCDVADVAQIEKTVAAVLAVQRVSLRARGEPGVSRSIRARTAGNASGPRAAISSTASRPRRR